MVKISVTFKAFSLRKDIDSLYATAFKLFNIVLFIYLSCFNSILRLRTTFKRSATVLSFIASIFSELNEKALSHSKFSASARIRLVLNFEFLEMIDFMPDYLDYMPDYLDYMTYYLVCMAVYLDYFDYLDYLDNFDLLVVNPLRSEGCLFDILDYCYLRRELSLLPIYVGSSKVLAKFLLV